MKYYVIAKHSKYKKDLLANFSGIVSDAKPLSKKLFVIETSECPIEDNRFTCEPLPENIVVSQDIVQTGLMSATSSSIDSNEINHGLGVSSFVSGINSSLESQSFYRTLTGYGVDIVVIDSGVLKDHPEFLDSQGTSRVVELDWPAVTGFTAEFPNFSTAEHYDQRYPKMNSHGTCMAGLAAGNRTGWAYNAKIYPIRNQGSDGSSISTPDAVGLVTAWHEQKKISGNYRPTIITISTSVRYNAPSIDVAAVDGIVGVNYQGTLYEVPIGSSDAVKAQYKITEQFALGFPFPARSAEYVTAYSEAIEAGVVIVNSAGNHGAYVAAFEDEDWDNNIVNIGYYNRGGCPGPDVGVIPAGNIKETLSSGKWVIQENSNRGPGIGGYVSGQNTATACTSGTDYSLPGFTVYSPILKTNYLSETNSDYLLGRFGGTSAASPQLAGIVATWAEANPCMTGWDALALISEHEDALVYEPTVSFTDAQSLWGDTSRLVMNYSANNKVRGIS